MSSRSGPVHVVTTTRHYKGRTYRTHLLRRSYRQDGKVRNETLGNLSHLPARIIEAEQQGWLGEAEGLKVSLAAANAKLAQVDGLIARRDAAVGLGMPAFPDIAGRTTTKAGRA